MIQLLHGSSFLLGGKELSLRKLPCLALLGISFLSAQALAQTSADAGTSNAPNAPAQSDSAQVGGTELPRETPIENSLRRVLPLSGTVLGGYGELDLNAPSNGPSVVDLRRVVFFIGHDFNESFRFYSELEIEHAVSSSVDQGSVEIEQAYLDWLVSSRFNLRGGLILMPTGIINIYHEPPSFFGVDRPDVDTYVIPTTWREPGLGIFGELAEGLRYQLYVVDGLNANDFSAQFGVRDGTQEGQLAYAGDFGVIGRLDYEPILGTVLGASVYGGTSGDTLTATVGHAPVGLFEVDARTRRGGFSVRLELALLLLGDARALDELMLATGPVSSRSQGGYLEAGYDLLRWWAPSSNQGLTPFFRLDYVDTQADVPSGFVAMLQYRRYSAIVGLDYKPIPQIALKTDYRRQQLGDGVGYNQFDAAITWLF